MPKPIPLLIFSDAPSASSGLARITRDIATRVATHMGDTFKVATIGYGGASSSRLPFFQYHWHFDGNWMIRELPDVWDDFCEDRRGIFMTIHDASRMLWLAQPDTGCEDKRLQEWLKSGPFQKWGYFPIDATGINDKFTLSLTQTYLGYDRVLAYTNWAKRILENSLEPHDCVKRDLSFIPHGIDTSIFYPRDRQHARELFCEHLSGRPAEKFRINDNDLVIGIVATNQIRKDFGLGLEVVARLARERPVKLWINTDMLERNWSIPSLLYDFGLMDRAVTTVAMNISDDRMAWSYSACDMTLGIGNAEGFGYPIFESLACGTPCIHGNDGGAAEFMPKSMLVQPYGKRIEGPYDCVRMFYRAEDWLKVTEGVLRRKDENVARVKLHPELDWTNVWARWKAWFERGIALQLPKGKEDARNSDSRTQAAKEANV